MDARHEAGASVALAAASQVIPGVEGFDSVIVNPLTVVIAKIVSTAEVVENEVTV
jgi:hypothetical protein